MVDKRLSPTHIALAPPISNGFWKELKIRKADDNSFLITSLDTDSTDVAEEDKIECKCNL